MEYDGVLPGYSTSTLHHRYDVVDDSPGDSFPTVARAIINTTVGRSPSNVGKEKPKVNACCLGSTGLFLHLRLTPVEFQRNEHK